MEDLFFYIIILGGLVFFAWQLFKKQGTKSAKMHSDYLIDLTEKARSENIDPITGRDDEIDRIIHVLKRRTKNNPLLIGEPGVGKTAIVEGLALGIVHKTVPSTLLNKRILSLSMSKLMSETQLRGEMEKRLNGVLHEIQKSGGDDILFIDEIHLIEQAGSSQGALAITDILKPALARGEIRIVGATTWKEYKQYIKPNDALDRRLQVVLVDEPSPDVALEILEHLRPLYEKFHDVKITDEALSSAVQLSDKFIHTRFLPDKAIDLLDEASAKASIEAELQGQTAVGAIHAASSKDVAIVNKQDIEDVVDQWIIHTKEEKQRDARHEEIS